MPLQAISDLPMPKPRSRENISRVTVRDVAKRAGVHPATVSRVLDPASRSRISDATARRVEKAVRELGYQTNSMARGLRTTRSFAVGVIIPDLTNPVFPPMIRGIEDHLRSLNYAALLSSTDNDPAREMTDISWMRSRQVDGFIIVPTPANMPVVAEMSTEGIPVVLMIRAAADIQAFSVTMDDRRGAALAVGHLAHLGHRKIAHLAGPQELSPGYERFRGFVEAMHERGLPTSDRLVAFASGFVAGAGVEPTRTLLGRKEEFTAVFAGNDLLALDCIDTLKAAGLRCPEEVSVIGFNDMPFAERFTPPLSTIRVSHYELGRTAAEILVKQIQGQDVTPKTVFLPTELVERGSTAPASVAGSHPRRRRRSQKT